MKKALQNKTGKGVTQSDTEISKSQVQVRAMIREQLQGNYGPGTNNEYC